MGSVGTLALLGKLVAVGGCTTPGLRAGSSNGGRVELVAQGNINIGNGAGLDANGGDSSGLDGGNGGRITIEAPTGTVNIDGVNIWNRGGDLTFASLGVAGEGGTTVIYGDSVLLSNIEANGNGGGITRGGTRDNDDIEGQGAGGGRIEVAGFTQMNFSSTTTLRSDGGDSNFLDQPGGNGGSISFQGTVEARAGLDRFGSFGDDGNICVRGASPAVIGAITGSNTFPITSCPSSSDG